MGEEGGRHLFRVDQSAVTWVASVIPLMEGGEDEEGNKGSFFQQRKKEEA